jgi:hypothetical protein
MTTAHAFCKIRTTIEIRRLRTRVASEKRRVYSNQYNLFTRRLAFPRESPPTSDTGRCCHFARQGHRESQWFLRKACPELAEGQVFRGNERRVEMDPIPSDTPPSVALPKKVKQPTACHPDPAVAGEGSRQLFSRQTAGMLRFAQSL